MKFYSVIKVNSDNGKETNYGTMCEEDMKLTTKGYIFDGIFITDKGANTFSS